jgi:hypothetical protein
MPMTTETRTRTAGGMAASDTGRRMAWIGLLTAACALLTLQFACATPFAALGALAAVNMSRRDAFFLAVSAWLANQAVGYGVLGYPNALSTHAWGIAIGIAGVLAVAAARPVANRIRATGAIVATIAAFIAASVTYQAALAPWALLLPGGTSAMSFGVVTYVLKWNAITLAVLLILHQLALRVGLVTRRTESQRHGPATLQTAG